MSTSRAKKGSTHDFFRLAELLSTIAKVRPSCSKQPSCSEVELWTRRTSSHLSDSNFLKINACRHDGPANDLPTGANASAPTFIVRCGAESPCADAKLPRIESSAQHLP